MKLQVSEPPWRGLKIFLSRTAGTWAVTVGAGVLVAGSTWVGVLVPTGVGLKVGEWGGVAVCERVWVGVIVRVEDSVRVGEGVKLSVSVRLGDLLAVKVGVWDVVRVGVKLRVSVWVADWVKDWLALGVKETVRVSVALGVEGLGAIDGVAVGVQVALLLGVPVGV